MKKILTKIMAVVMAMAMVMGTVPAEGAKAAGEQAKMILKCIVEPTLAYKSVYGFFNNVSTVTDKDDKVGLIDITGKEVIPCGKYKVISNLPGYDGLFASTDDKHGYLLDFSGNVKVDLGQAEYASTTRNESGIVVIKTTNSGTNEYSEWDLNGNFIKKGQHGNIFGIPDNIANSEKYDKVLKVADNRYVALLKTEDVEPKTYELLDESGVVIASVDDLTQNTGISYNYNACINYYKNVYDEENGASYSFVEVMDLNGMVVIEADRQFDDIIYGAEKYICARYARDGKWYVMNLKGETINSFSVDYISDIDIESGMLLGKNYTEDGKSIYVLANINTGKVTNISSTNTVYFDHYVKDTKICEIYDKDGSYTSVYDLNGNLEFDATKYVGLYDQVYPNSIYYSLCKLSAKKTDTDNENGSKAYDYIDVVKADGSLVGHYANGKEVSWFDDGSYNVFYSNEDIASYGTDGKLEVFLEYSKFSDRGALIDNIVPLKSKSTGMWGIYQLADNGVNAPATQLPAAQQPAARQPVATQPSVTSTSQTTANKVSAPAKVNAKKVKLVAGKKKVTVKLPSMSKNVKGYLVQYSLKKNFKNSKKLTTAKKSVAIKKLKSGKTYYIRFKAYTLDGKKKAYSKNWSKVMKVKIK